MFVQRTLGSPGGQTVQVARKKCIAKSCFDVHKNHFGERSTLFRRRFKANEFGQCLIRGKCKFLNEKP